MDEVGRRLAQWRTDAGLSQAAVGEAVGEVLGRRFGQSVIANYETRGTPRSWQFLVALAQRFPPSVLDLDWLLRGQPQGETPDMHFGRSFSAVSESGQFAARKIAGLAFEFPDHFVRPAELSDSEIETYLRSLDVTLRFISRKVRLAK